MFTDRLVNLIEDMSYDEDEDNEDYDINDMIEATLNETPMTLRQLYYSTRENATNLSNGEFQKKFHVWFEKQKSSKNIFFSKGKAYLVSNIVE